MTVVDSKELAEAHADWFVEQMRWVYVQAFIHGEKHGYERGRASVLVPGKLPDDYYDDKPDDG